MESKTAIRLEILIAFSVLLIVACVCSSSGTSPTVISTPTESNNTVVEQPTVEEVPTEQPTAVSENPIGKVGETVTQGGYSITLANVETATQYGDFMTAGTGNKFLAVEIVIRSGADSGVNVNPFYAKVKDSSGYEYTTNLLGKEPALQSQNDLPNGELVRGWITFEVPENASGFIFTYEPLSFTTTVRIRFDLGQ